MSVMVAHEAACLLAATQHHTKEMQYVVDRLGGLGV